MKENSKPQKFKKELQPQSDSCTNRDEEEKQPSSNNQNDPVTASTLAYHKHNRAIRIGYAIVAAVLAIMSVCFWGCFVCFKYKNSEYSDTFFATLTTACTINILAAFISVAKGIFPHKK